MWRESQMFAQISYLKQLGKRCQQHFGSIVALAMLAVALCMFLSSNALASIRVTNPYDFGPVPVGEAREITLMIRNTSYFPMKGAASVVSPPFTLNNQDHVYFSIGPRGNKKLTLRFSPTAAGDFRTSLCLAYCYGTPGICDGLEAPPPSTAGCANGANTYGPYKGSGEGILPPSLHSIHWSPDGNNLGGGPVVYGGCSPVTAMLPYAGGVLTAFSNVGCNPNLNHIHWSPDGSNLGGGSIRYEGCSPVTAMTPYSGGVLTGFSACE